MHEEWSLINTLHLLFVEVGACMVDITYLVSAVSIFTPNVVEYLNEQRSKAEIFGASSCKYCANCVCKWVQNIFYVQSGKCSVSLFFPGN